MKHAKWFLPLISIVMTCVVAAWAAEKPPATQPSDGDSKPAAKSKSSSGRWGFSPYNLLTSCTEEQKQKITEIHRNALDEKKAIEEKEEADIMAILTDEQKAELDKILADRKAKAAEKRAAAKKDKAKAGGDAGDDDEKDK